MVRHDGVRFLLSGDKEDVAVELSAHQADRHINVKVFFRGRPVREWDLHESERDIQSHCYEIAGLLGDPSPDSSAMVIGAARNLFCWLSIHGPCGSCHDPAHTSPVLIPGW